MRIVAGYIVKKGIGIIFIILNCFKKWSRHELHCHKCQAYTACVDQAHNITNLCYARNS